MKTQKKCFAFCVYSIIVLLFILVLVSFFDFFIIFPTENRYDKCYITQPARMSKHDIISLSSQNIVYEFEQDDQENQIETVEIITKHEVAQNKKYIGTFLLTAYCSCEKCCGKYAGNRPIDENGKEIVFGASGERLYQGISIAVDPKIIPYGSKVLIGNNEYIAHDCGGAIKGNKIDVYFDNHSDAINFGRQSQDVYLLVS